MKPKLFYFLLAGLLTLTTLATLGGYFLASQALNQRKQVLRQELTQSALADERIDQLTSLRSQFKQLSPLAAKLDSALPRTKKQSEIILQIQQVAAASGMGVANISFQSNNGLPTDTSQAIQVADYFAMPISFQLAGSYAQLQSFLQQLESLERYTSVTQLSISRSGSRLTFTINLNAFFKP